MTIRDTVIGGNRSFGIVTAGASANALMIDRTSIANNGDTGILVDRRGLARSRLQFGHYRQCDRCGASGGGVLRSYKNNAINGNTTEGTPITQENLN